jgi:4-amino-4-deoxy-L-arabinose transferase-like glycosyltransferase
MILKNEKGCGNLDKFKIGIAIIITLLVLGIVAPKLISYDSDLIVVIGIAVLIGTGLIDWVLIKSTNIYKRYLQEKDNENGQEIKS